MINSNCESSHWEKLTVSAREQTCAISNNGLTALRRDEMHSCTCDENKHSFILQTGVNEGLGIDDAFLNLILLPSKLSTTEITYPFPTNGSIGTLPSR